MTIDRHEMGNRHEEWLAEVLGGRKTPGSGNQWRNPADGRQNRYVDSFAFAWDGKSTRSNSISITREMLSKIKEQADTERPMIALRFYDDDRLRSFEDWIAIKADDFLELLEAATSPSPLPLARNPEFENWRHK